jgi:hypothetical protein
LPKLVEDTSESIKRRKSKELRKSVGSPELTHATKMSLRSAGKADAAKRCNEAFKTKTTRGLRIIRAWDAHAKNVLVPYTPEEHSICLLKLI